MKVLKLCWNENRVDFYAVDFYIGNDTAPSVPDMVQKIKDTVPGFSSSSGDLHSYLSMDKATPTYDEVHDLLLESGYVHLDECTEVNITVK
jgi:hypothetical protein